MASFEKTSANSVYSGGRVDFGLAFSAAMASSVAVVSFRTARGDMNRDPYFKILLMVRLFKELSR